MTNTQEFSSVEKKARTKKIIGKVLVYALLVIWALCVLFPFYWMILTSVKSYATYNSEYIPKFITLTPTLQNYADAFSSVPLARYFLNTISFITSNISRF